MTPGAARVRGRRFARPIGAGRGAVGVWVLLLSLSALAIWPADAWAQRRLSVEAEVGALLVPGPVQRRNVTLLANGDQGQVPVLFHDYAQPSLSYSLRVVASSLEVGYTLDSIRLGRGVGVCVGEGEAAELGNGSIDDTGVRYQCGDRFTIDGLPRAAPTMTIHHLGGGLRFVRRRRSEAAQGEIRTGFGGLGLYAVGGGGFSLSNYAFDIQQRRWRPGFHLMAGVGMDLPITRALTITLTARYRFVVLSSSLPASAAAARAEDAGSWVGSAMFEGLHLFTVGLGLRFSFR